MPAGTLARAIEGILSPVGILTLLMAGGLVASLSRRWSGLGHRLLASGAAVWILGTCLPLAELSIFALERPYRPLSSLDSVAADTIVILSAYAEDHPTIPVTSTVSDQTMCRLVEGIRLYHQRPHLTVVVSGGAASGRPFALIMADFLRAMGIPEGDLRVESRSRNTYENLREVKTIVGDRPFVLVATAADLRRALAVARRLGMRAIPAPACIWALEHWSPDMGWQDWVWQLAGSVGPPSTQRWAYLQWAHHEYLGYVWYAWLGRL
jgi:uncharacterized SAM-binding protein YcdF (DUF218 family)